MADNIGMAAHLAGQSLRVGDGLIEFRLIAAKENDLRTLGGEITRRRTGEHTGGAGDDDHATGNIEERRSGHRREEERKRRRLPARFRISQSSGVQTLAAVRMLFARKRKPRSP